MTRAILIAIFSIFSVPAIAAPEFLDGSDKGIDQQILQSLNMALIADNVRDPSSAQYYSVTMTNNAKFGDVLCGFVNLKNGYGAYIGYKPFQLRLKTKTLSILSTAPNEVAYSLARLPFEWTGCDQILDVPHKS